MLLYTDIFNCQLEKENGMAGNKLNDFGLTDRDMDILDLVVTFGGKTFFPVLEQTAFLGAKPQTVRNRINVLRAKKKLFRLKPTGLMKPRSAIVLTEEGKRFVQEIFGETGLDASVSASTTWHNIYEQVTYYWLKQIGKDPIRTIVSKWSKQGYRHTPDLAYKNPKGGLVYVEVELTRKRAERLIDIFNRMKADGVSAALYVFENEQKIKTLGTKIPAWDKIRYTTIPRLIEGAQSGKLDAVKQIDFYKEMGVKNG